VTKLSHIPVSNLTKGLITTYLIIRRSCGKTWTLVLQRGCETPRTRKKRLAACFPVAWRAFFKVNQSLRHIGPIIHIGSNYHLLSGSRREHLQPETRIVSFSKSQSRKIIPIIYYYCNHIDSAIPTQSIVAASVRPKNNPRIFNPYTSIFVYPEPRSTNG